MTEADQAALIADFVDCRVWAVIGVSNDPNKYGNRVFRSLRGAGYTVYGVNPHTREVDGQPIYPSLEALPERPEVVDMVVPPPVTEQVLQDCARLGLKRVWLQPGAESAAALRFCREHDIAVLHGVCAMVHKKTWPSGPAQNS